jgi:hypothetical protein
MSDLVCTSPEPTLCCWLCGHMPIVLAAAAAVSCDGSMVVRAPPQAALPDGAHPCGIRLNKNSAMAKDLATLHTCAGQRYIMYKTQNWKNRKE